VENFRDQEAEHPVIAWQWKDDRFEPCDSIPLTDRGFRYGMSLFESVMIRSGRPVFLSEHRNRLVQSCAQCDFKFDAQAFDRIEELLCDSLPNGLARIYVTAGDGAVSSPAEDCRIFVFVEPRVPFAPVIYERGYKVVTVQEKHHPIFGGLKTANYWANIAALNRVRPKNEALLFNEHGGLISACMANVFIVQNGILRTPMLVCGARAGIVREWVLRRIETEECALTYDDLKAATEIFLTSSWIGIMPVSELDNRPLPERSIARRLRVDFEQALGG